MAEEFALIQRTVPTTMGTVSYTDSAIANFSCAIGIISGNTTDSTDGGRFCVFFISDDGAVQNYTFIAARGQDGLTTVNNRQQIDEGGTNAAVILDDGTPNSFPYVAATLDSTSSSGFTLDWTDVEAGKNFEMAIALIGGLTDVHIGRTGDENSVGFEPDAVFMLNSGDSFSGGGAAGADGHVGLGLAVNDGSASQMSYAINWPNGVDPTEAYGLSRSNRFVCDLENPNVEESRQLTGFDSMGFNVGAPTGGPAYSWLAMQFSSADREAAVAFEDLSGLTGNQSFTGLGIRPMLVLGIISGVSTQDVVEGSNARFGSVGVFLSDGTDTYSISFAFTEGVDVNPTTTTAFSSFSDGTVSMLDDAGSETFSATLSTTATGIDLNISDGITTGSMMLMAISTGALFEVSEDTEDIVETANRAVYRSLADTEDLNEEVGSVLFEHTFTTELGVPGLAYDVAEGGAQADGTSLGGAVAGDDSGSI